MRRVLVSGVTGHLGRVLARQLAGSGVEVHGLTRGEEAAPEPAVPLHLHRIDGRTETLVNLLQEIRPHTVFHLAAAVRGTHEAASVVPLVEANVLHGAQLLESMRVCGCGQIVVAGSYLQHAETIAYRALNLYAATKQAFEALLEYYAEAFDISAVRLTVCNVYSEHEVRASLMTDIAQAFRQRSTLVVRDPEVRVDLVHVDDVARSFVQAASLMEGTTVPRGSLSKFSVTSGRDFSPAEIVRFFEDIGSRKLAVRYLEGSGQTRRAKPWRGETVPGWEPRVSIEEGITRIVKQVTDQDRSLSAVRKQQ